MSKYEGRQNESFKRALCDGNPPVGEAGKSQELSRREPKRANVVVNAPSRKLYAHPAIPASPAGFRALPLEILFNSSI